MRRRAIRLWPARKSQRDGRNATRYKAVWPSGWFFEGGAPFFVKIIFQTISKKAPDLHTSGSEAVIRERDSSVQGAKPNSGRLAASYHCNKAGRNPLDFKM